MSEQIMKTSYERIISGISLDFIWTKLKIHLL